MNRRAAIRAVLGSVIAVVVLGAPGGDAGIVAPSVGAQPAEVVAVSDPPPPPVTVNEFLPEEQNLGDCLGALERPGCGSEARGGWRQTAVFVVMAAGLVIVFGRVGLGVYRNRT